MDLFGSPNIDRMVTERDYDGLYRCLEHRSKYVRLRAAQALAEMEDGAGWRTLMDLVRQPGDPESRLIAAAMLGELGHHRAVPVLEEALKTAKGDLEEVLRNSLELIGGRQADEALRAAGPPPPPSSVPAISPPENMFGSLGSAFGEGPILDYELPYRSGSDTIQFLTPEQHYNTAVELREDDLAERGLVEVGLALWLNPEWPEAWYLRGVLLEDLEREFEAALAYRRALELQPTLADARDALAELDEELGPPDLDKARLLVDLTSRDYQERRDAAAGLGELSHKTEDPALADALILALDDDEREVRHAVIEALGETGDPRAARHLLEQKESSWLLRFAIIEALTLTGDIRSVAQIMYREMDRIQERNPIFSGQRDPLVEVEYDRLLEIGALAMQHTEDLHGLLEAVEGFNVSRRPLEEQEPADEGYEDSIFGAAEDEDFDYDGEFNADHSPYAIEFDDEDDEALIEDMREYVDEVALMTAAALERLAMPRLADLDDHTLTRIAHVPDLTFLDVSEEDAPGGQAEPTIVYDLDGLRHAALLEIRARGPWSPEVV
jgi:HEAT repeat protein